MTQVILPYRPVAGDPEDISQILADFDAILNVMNGDLKNDNLAAIAAIVVSKLAGGIAGDRLETVGTTVQWVKNCKAAAYGPQQSLPHAALTPLGLNSRLYDTDTLTDPLAAYPQNSRVTCHTDGLYLCTGNVSFVPGVAGIRAEPRIAQLRVNGTIGKNSAESPCVAPPDNTIVGVSDLIPMVAGDYVQICGYQVNGGNALNAGGYLAVARIGA